MTKITMTLSSIILGISGLALTFMPDVLMEILHLDPNKTSQLLLQILGGLYFAFSMLNWMTKESLIGGIYNRPIAIANFTHFLISGLAILKGLNSKHELPAAFIVAGIVYSVFGILYIIILFRHPVKNTQL